MNSMDQVQAANKRRRETYSKSRAQKECIAVACNTIPKKEQGHIRKARSRAKKKKKDKNSCKFWYVCIDRRRGSYLTES